jgi:hypothetical protein
MSKPQPGRPPFPAGFEKRDERIPLHCSQSEHLLWRNVFGPRGVSVMGRTLLNQAAEKKLGRSMFNSG